MIVLRTPKGWTGPKEVDGLQVRGHLARAPGAAGRPAATTSTWRCWRSGCAPTGPRSCSTTAGRLRPELRRLAPRGERRMGGNPHTNGGLLLRDLALPDFRAYAAKVEPGGTVHEPTRVLGGWSGT